MTFNDEDWDYILNDTWHHNKYFELMCSILYKKYPLEVHESHADCWWDEKTFTADELRDGVIGKIETYWKEQVSEAMAHQDDEIKQLKMLVVMMHGDRELGDYWQDMANDIMTEDREREELQDERERNEDETGISETDDERDRREEEE